MSYRQPAFMVDNAVSAIKDTADIYEWAYTEAPSTASRRAWIDGRQGTVGTFETTAGGNGAIRMDLQAIPPAGHRTMIVPDGHTFTGKLINVYRDDSFSFGSAVQIEGFTAAAGVIEREATSDLEQFLLWRVQDSSGGDVYTLAGWWIGEKETLSDDAYVDPRFGNRYQSQIAETEYPGGTAALEIAPPRRRFTLDVRNVLAGSADYTLLDSVAQARARSFWYWPPDTEDAGPYLVRLTQDVQRVQDFKAPAVATHYRFRLEMLEDKL